MNDGVACMFALVLGGRPPLLDLALGKDKSALVTTLVELLVSMGVWSCGKLSELLGGLGSESES